MDFPDVTQTKFYNDNYNANANVHTSPVLMVQSSSLIQYTVGKNEYTGDGKTQLHKNDIDFFLK